MANTGTDKSALMRVLVYSDDASVREQVRLAIGRRPAADVPRVEFVECATAPAVLKRLEEIDIDVAVFDGSWHCLEDGEGAQIAFQARIDMGIPSLADALEPIAARTLVDNTVAIVGGLLAGAVLHESSVTTPANDATRAVA